MLESDGSIESDATVIFVAEEEITELADFSVPSGSCFLAENTTCEDKLADVIAVDVSGNSGYYQFSVTIESPDTFVIKAIKKSKAHLHLFKIQRGTFAIKGSRIKLLTLILISQ